MLIRYLKDRLEAYRAEKRFVDTERDWGALRSSIQSVGAVSSPPQRFIVVPCDPWTLTGSRGDEAMIFAVINQIKNQSPGLKVGIVTGNDVASAIARKLGFVPLQVWRQPLPGIVEEIRNFRPDGLAVLGADCMDGYYSADTTLCLLALADLAARMGVRSTILGFSFNENPSPRLKAAFDSVDSRVSINVRDEVSFGRFQRFTSAKAQLVADAAFMLPPVLDAKPVLNAASWAKSQRDGGQLVLGFNFHPMLIKSPTAEQLAKLISNVIDALTKFMRDVPNASVALISHDYRGAGGDDTCLKPVARALGPVFGERIFYQEDECSAAELKGIAGLMDGVVTGRMHLAIASLGMGVPVAALTYQDKFQGLMRHVRLPQELLLPPSSFVGPESLVELLMHFVRNLSKFQCDVRDRLPVVKGMSAMNVQKILSS